MTINHRPYTIFPFRFTRFGKDVLLANEGGEFIFLSENSFTRLRTYQLSTADEAFLDLKSKHIVTDSDQAIPVYLLATKYRTKKSFLSRFTALHIFIITLRCNQRCRYCQASSEDETKIEFDMNITTAKKCVDMVFRSPSPEIKIEFQGGEPLLNFGTIRYVVDYAEKLNRIYNKDLEFVICTNLLAINDAILDFLAEHKIWISTSLDGPKELHDNNRITREGGGTYGHVIKNIQLAQDKLGIERVSALMVTSKVNIDSLNDVVDEYIKRRFNSIFIRTLHPFGRAAKGKLGYEVASFIKNYIKTLDYIIKLNLDGVNFSEQYATIILTKILTPFATNFVDLQSPAGAGISCAVYGYNGDVFVSDEGRMLSKMGDNRFLMGNVQTHQYQEIFNGKVIRSTVGDSCVENMPLCSECAFQMYCGADPVRNYSVGGDLIGHQPTSEFHQINYLIIRYLMLLIRQNKREVMNVLWSWITNKPSDDIRKTKREE
jgi:uncharacterized protein